MKHLGLDLHCFHVLDRHHQRLTDVEQGLQKKDENSCFSLQQMEKLPMESYYLLHEPKQFGTGKSIIASPKPS